MANYTTTSAPLPWMEPYLQDYMARSQEMANQGYTPPPSTYVDPNSALQQGWQVAANRALQGSPAMGAATTAMQNTLGGQYMGRQAAVAGGGEGMNAYANTQNAFTPMNNPYLTESIANAQGDLAKSWNLVDKPQWDKAMQGSGSFGNTGVAEMNLYGADQLQKNMGRIGNDMRFNAYQQSANLDENRLQRMYGAGESQLQRQFQGSQNQAQRQDNVSNLERQMQMQAMSMAPQVANQDWTDIKNLLDVGAQRQGFLQDAANQNYKWWDDANKFRDTQLDKYGQRLGLGGQGGVTTQQQPDPSAFGQAAGGALTMAMLAKLMGWGG